MRMVRGAILAGAFVLLLFVLIGALTGCDNGPKAGDKCNHAGAKSGNGLVCRRNNKTTGPLVWRRATALPMPAPGPEWQ